MTVYAVTLGIATVIACGVVAAVGAAWLRALAAQYRAERARDDLWDRVMEAIDPPDETAAWRVLEALKEKP